MGSQGIRKNSTLICAPLMADSVEEIVVQMNRAKSSGADLVEIRLDSLKNFNPVEDVQSLIKQCPLPTLFTYRFVEWLLTFVRFLLVFDECCVQDTLDICRRLN